MIEFDCPRCFEPAKAVHYGPCSACRAELREMRQPEPDSRFGPPKPIPYGDDSTRPVPS